MKNTKGFTLIELLIVLSLIAILITILIVIIKPGEIFKKARNSQRIGDLRNLASAVDAYINEIASGANLAWPSRLDCSYIFFSVASFPANWPQIPVGYNFTGTTSPSIDGSGWLPLNFKDVSILNLTNLPLDPRNGKNVCGPQNNMGCAYEFSCTNDQKYEIATALEDKDSTDDGGNQNNLYEVGPGSNILY